MKLFPPGILSADGFAPSSPRDALSHDGAWHQPAITRRGFLTDSAVAAMSLALPRRVAATSRRIPINRTTRHSTANAWLPTGLPADELRALALVAMDTAKHAGADFADVRIGIKRSVYVEHNPHGDAWVSLTVGYGVRAWIDGTWSFQHGNVFTRDAVAATARSAVTGARTYAAVNKSLPNATALLSSADWAPTPVVTGEWRVPVEIDPFTVPLDDYHRALEVLRDLIILEGGNRTFRLTKVGEQNLGWNTECRVFASTAGSLVTQHTIDGGPEVGGAVGSWESPLEVIPVDLPEVPPRRGGFEVVLAPDLVPHLMTGIDDALMLSELPLRAFGDVGRYPIVLDGATMANLIGNTVDAALDGDRVLGIEADAAGTSFLTPATEVLGATKPQFSPLLSMTADRAMPSTVAVQWDDDGVVPEPYALIEQGRVVGFHTTRETAAVMAEWNARRGLPVRSHGCSVAPTAASVPVGGGTHVHVAPTTARAGRTELMREIKRGFLVRQAYTKADPSLTGGFAGDGDVVLEIQNGVPVARTTLTAQFVTKTLLAKQLVAVGDASTVRSATVGVAKGIPWETVTQVISAPAMLCKDVDVVKGRGT